MNRSRTYRWVRRVVWGTLAVVLTFGCSPLTTIAFLTQKDVKTPAAYPLCYKEGPKKEKEEVVVAVFVSQGTEQSFEFAGADSTLAAEIAKRLPEMAKEAKQEQKIEVVPTAKVNKFKYQNQSWKLMHPAERGRQLGADFVLVVHLDRMSMFKPGTRNEFYEGRADVTVDVYDVDDGEVEPKTYNHGFTYPKAGFRDASAMPASAFKRGFLETLSVELCRYHVEHKPSSGIAEGR